MRNLSKRLFAIAVSLGLTLGGALAAAGEASAAPLTSVSASTSVTNHPDTTSATGSACTSSPGGSVWALDNYTSDMTAVNTSGNDWAVSISDSGTFAGFANPVTCTPGPSHGAFTGTYTVYVTSPSAPIAADLKAVYDGPISTSTMVEDFFGGAATAVTGGDYNFSYQGGAYVQSSIGGVSKTTGDVSLDCAVTIKPIADQAGILGDKVSLQVQASTNVVPLPNVLNYSAIFLPSNLSIDQTTGKISGTLAGPAGTSTVTIGVANESVHRGDANCVAEVTFKWTVSKAAPTPASNRFPTGGVATGGGTDHQAPWRMPLALAVLAFAVAGGAVILRPALHRATRRRSR